MGSLQRQRPQPVPLFRHGPGAARVRPLSEWRMEGLPLRTEGYTLDLDSTVLERYWHQEGSLNGHNPRIPAVA
jgi:hypothetical protein